MTHTTLKNWAKALYFAKRATGVDPANIAGRVLLAQVLDASGDREAAIAELRPLAQGPGAHPAACCKLSEMLTKSGLADEAVELTRAWLARWPGDYQITIAACESMFYCGEIPQLLGMLERAVVRFPRNPELVQWQAALMNYPSDIPEVRVLEPARAFAATLPGPDAGAPPRRCVGDGPLRVGFLSSDLHVHSVTYFLEPLLANLDSARVLTFCYYTGTKPDECTERLRALAHAWRTCDALDTELLLRGIRSDSLDVLVDLTGHTRGARSAVLARKAASVQVSYLGYANFTAIPAIDARIGDARTDPPGEPTHAVERLARLDPCFVCYRPPASLPELPARLAGHPVVFGSFNALQKLSDRTIEMWSGALRAVPASRLMLKSHALECEGIRRTLAGRFAVHGVSADRLEFLGSVRGLREHFVAYAGVDIALDTFPYNGTTTTCEAMAMGLPVVSRAGDSHRARVGCSLLAAVGLSELVGKSDEDFVRIAASLASDRSRLSRLHAADAGGVRTRLLTSPLCDALAHAAAFERTLRTLAP